LLRRGCDELLREDGAEPAFEGAAARVGVEFGDAAARGAGDAIEVGIDLVGEFAGVDFVPGDAASGCIEGGAKAEQEGIPGGGVAGRAGAGENEFIDAQFEEEFQLIGLGGAGSIAEEDGGDVFEELGGREAVPRSFGAGVETLDGLRNGGTQRGGLGNGRGRGNHALNEVLNPASTMPEK